MTEERKYTLFEAKLEMIRQQCSLDYHKPDSQLIGFGLPASKWTCKCGAYAYVPKLVTKSD
jgi:hypothetical protein